MRSKLMTCLVNIITGFRAGLQEKKALLLRPKLCLLISYLPPARIGVVLAIFAQVNLIGCGRFSFR